MDVLNSYIEENNLKLKIENVKTKYLCNICKSILTNPKISDCSCTYCENCIDRYVTDGGKKCPNCKSVVDFTVGLYPDIMMRKKILELLIECPHLFCNEIISVKLMTNHLKQCDRKGYRCTLGAFGCQGMVKDKVELRSHIKDNLNDHMDLIVTNMNENSQYIKTVQNINTKNTKKLTEIESNQIAFIKYEIDKIKNNSKREIDKLKKILDNSKKEIDGLKSSRDHSKAELVNAHKEIKKQAKKLIDEEAKTNLLREELAICSKKLIEVEKENSILKKHSLIAPDLGPREYKLKLNETESMKPGIYYCSTFRLLEYSFKVAAHIDDRSTPHFDVYLLENEISEELKWPFPFEMQINKMSSDKSLFKTTLTHNDLICRSYFDMPTNCTEVNNDMAVVSAKESERLTYFVTFKVK